MAAGKLTGASALWIHANDLEGAVVFWRDRVGLPVKRVHEVVAEVTLPDGFKLMVETPHEGMVVTPGTFELAVQTEDIDAAVARLRSNGVRIEDEISDVPDGRAIAFWDPDGYQFMLCQTGA